MKKSFDLKKFGKYFLTFIGYCLFSLIDGNHSPYAISLFTANLFVGLKPITSLVLLMIPFIFSGSVTVILTTLFAGGIIAVTFLIYRKYKRLPSFEIVGFMAVALTPYATFSTAYSLPLRLTVCAVTVLSTFVLTSASRVILLKGIKYRLEKDDIISASILLIICGYGLIIAFGEGFYLAVAVFFVLLSSLFFGSLTPLLTGIIASFALSFFRFDLTPIAVLCIYASVICACGEYSRLLTAIGTVSVTAVLYLFSNYFAPLSAYSPFFTAISSAVYLFIPDRSVKKAKSKLRIYRTEGLGRYAVNLCRNTLSGKLFEISAVFDEMASSIQKLKDRSPSDETVTAGISDEILISVCSRCQSFKQCRRKKFPSDEELKKIVGLGLAKGSLSVSDLPKSFTEKCKFPEEVVLFANKLLARYKSVSEEKEALSESRELILKHTDGLSKTLKAMAGEMSKQLSESKQVENNIADNLLSCGIYAKEVAFYRGGDSDELYLIIPKSELFNPFLIKAINEKLGYKTVIAHNQPISEELCAITVRRAPTLDAVFGIARKTKSESSKSGDTHSIIKLNEGKFMIALNDGMGSGESAEDTSATALSLVESFYRAGLSSESILPIVNKILTFSREDNFTAMDLGVVDLFAKKADFVKIGSPYSFILTKDSVKIIEGNSLPLGILDEMRPTTCTAELSSGDVIMLVSDGITDAFASSSDLIAYLSEQRALNPKTLADNVLEKALFLSQGTAKDDMTVFCVRVFQKSENE